MKAIAQGSKEESRKILLFGTIKKISFRSSDYAECIITDGGEDFEFSFRNNSKSHRASDIARMHLVAGDMVLISGVEDSAARNKYHGWDVKQKGWISIDGYSLFTASVRRSIGWKYLAVNRSETISYVLAVNKETAEQFCMGDIGVFLTRYVKRHSCERAVSCEKRSFASCASCVLCTQKKEVYVLEAKKL